MTDEPDDDAMWIEWPPVPMTEEVAQRMAAQNALNRADDLLRERAEAIKLYLVTGSARFDPDRYSLYDPNSTNNYEPIVCTGNVHHVLGIIEAYEACAKELKALAARYAHD